MSGQSPVRWRWASPDARIFSMESGGTCSQHQSRFLHGSTTRDRRANASGNPFGERRRHALSATYTYSARNQLTASSRYSDSSATTLVGTSSYGYDDAGRVTSITHKDAATPTPNTLDAFNYTYDGAGRVATETSTLGPSRTYSYDAAGQLTGDGTNNYIWDAEGNRVATGWTTTTGNLLTSDGTWNYSYDAEGNQIQKIIPSTGEQWNYYYDNLNRLVKAEHKPSSSGSVDQRITFKYDVFGNRIEKAVGVSSPTITHFAYDLNGNAWADLDGNNSNALLMRRLYADAVDAVFARSGTAANSTAWYLDDRLGSIRNIAGNTGSLIDHRDWDSFGKMTNETQPSNGDRYGWTSREADAELNDQYSRARRYNPSTERWTTQDSAGFNAGDSNLYRYVNNVPTELLDPAGLDALNSGGSTGPDWSRYIPSDPSSRMMQRFIDLFNSEEERRRSREDLLDFFRVGRPPDSAVSNGNAWVDFLNSRAVAASVDYMRSEPGLVASSIPVWGNMRNMIYNIDQGNYGWGAFYAAMIVVDVVPVGSIIGTGGRVAVGGGGRIIGSGSRGLVGQLPRIGHGFVDMHHGIPRQIINEAREAIRRYIRGMRGRPNRLPVERRAHQIAHNGGANGGMPRYNDEFRRRLEHIAANRRVTWRDYWDIRARMLWEYFGIM
jgi:RHS repeat-associated protein